jgi:hypothetical protein
MYCGSNVRDGYIVIPVVAGAVAGAVSLVILVVTVCLYRRRAQRLKMNAVKSLSNSSKNNQTFSNSMFYESSSADFKFTRREVSAHTPVPIMVLTALNKTNTKYLNSSLQGEQESSLLIYSSPDPQKNLHFRGDGGNAVGVLYTEPTYELRSTTNHVYVNKEDTSSALYQVPTESGNSVKAQRPRGAHRNALCCPAQ